MCYGRQEFDKFRSNGTVLHLAELITYFQEYLGEFIRKDIYETSLVDSRNRPVFRSSDSYYILATFPKNKAIFDRQFAFDPFDDNAWDFSSIQGALEVYDSNNNLILGSNVVRHCRHLLELSESIRDSAAAFMVDSIVDFFNSEQKWYTSKDYESAFENAADFLDKELVEARYIGGLDDDFTISQIRRSISHCVVSMLRAIPELEIIYSSILNKTSGWELISARIKGGIINIFSLGDVRILEFEYNLLEGGNE